jgi:SAM-dependent methyltransferase
MSGFSADWLSLREPADHAARNPALLAELEAYFSDQSRLDIVDLGCGTGSNLRALAAHLPPLQHWLLVDHDPELLKAAQKKLIAFADEVISTDPLHIVKGKATLFVRFQQADLAAGAADFLMHKPDLVTAAALFDLISAPWITKFAQDVAAIGAVFYTALTYNGVHEFQPTHPLDGSILAAFHRHQQSDKGFGLAAGPQAPQILAEAFEALDYEVDRAPSPWILSSPRVSGPAHQTLQQELIRGIAAAVRETGSVGEEDTASWLEAHLAGTSCQIGHEDCLAVP